MILIIKAAAMENRRYNDETFQAHIADDKRIQEEILIRLDTILTMQADMLAMVKIYRNTRGFLITLKLIGIATIALATFSGVVAGIVAAFKMWVKS